MNASQLAEATGGRLLQGDPGYEIPRAIADSRMVQAGDLFVAIRGEHTDGHLYAMQAVRAGARAVLAEHPMDLPPDTALIQVGSSTHALLRAAHAIAGAYRGTVVAVTGSVGKTTTKELTAAALSPLGEVFRNPGNYNSEIGLPLALFSLRASDRAAVFELGMRGLGEIRRLAGIVRPRIGIVTVIGESHLEVLGSVERIARAKAELLSALPQDGTAVLNRDDPWTDELRLHAPGRIVFAGRGEDADLRIVSVRDAAEGVELTLWYRGQTATAKVPLVGEGAALDAALAVGAAITAGVPFAAAVAALAQVAAPPGRLRRFVAHGITVLDDTYNSAPQSARVALALLGSTPSSGRRVAVLGDMRELGQGERELHLALGGQAAESADVVLAIGDFADEIVFAAREAGAQAERVRGIDELVGRLRTLLDRGDVVLFKASRAIALERAVREFLGVRT